MSKKTETTQEIKRNDVIAIPENCKDVAAKYFAMLDIGEISITTTKESVSDEWDKFIESQDESEKDGLLGEVTHWTKEISKKGKDAEYWANEWAKVPSAVQEAKKSKEIAKETPKESVKQPAKKAKKGSPEEKAQAKAFLESEAQKTAKPDNLPELSPKLSPKLKEATKKAVKKQLDKDFAEKKPEEKAQKTEKKELIESAVYERNNNTKEIFQEVNLIMWTRNSKTFELSDGASVTANIFRTAKGTYSKDIIDAAKAGGVAYSDVEGEGKDKHDWFLRYMYFNKFYNTAVKAKKNKVMAEYGTLKTEKGWVIFKITEFYLYTNKKMPIESVLVKK